MNGNRVREGRGWFVPLLLFAGFIWCGELCHAAIAIEVGETVRYTIRVGGFKVGTQTVTVAAEEYLDGTKVFRISGVTETKGISRIFCPYTDRTSVLVDTDTFQPIAMERCIEDKGETSWYVYRIDQKERRVTIFERYSGNRKVLHCRNVVFDQLSLYYFYRRDPCRFKGSFSFDFLKKDTIATVHMREEGQVNIRLPASNGDAGCPALKYAEEGGSGLEMYAGIDGTRIPLKIAFMADFEEKEKKSLIELYLKDVLYPDGGDGSSRRDGRRGRKA